MNYSLLLEGKLQGESGISQHISTVISDVYVFSDKVLKIYKRDVEWWNRDMQDLSGGASRVSFITNDFHFNQALNPEVYKELKVLTEEEGALALRDPEENDDELVIVMNVVDTSQTMTKLLTEQMLSNEDFYNIGKSFAEAKRSLSRDFFPTEIKINWHDQLVGRFKDLEGWVSSAPDFPPDVAEQAMKILWSILEENKEKFNAMSPEHLAVSLDCNPENLLFKNGKLSFMDVYPPKNDWRSAAFDHDVLRVASDIYALCGMESYNSYMKGVYEIAEKYLDKSLHNFYVLYGAMIHGPYFYMLSRKNSVYIKSAEKYLTFIKGLINSGF